MEQKRTADIFQELLDYLWNGLGLEEKGWKRLKKGDFKKKMKSGPPAKPGACVSPRRA